ncbi:hypothetical protein CDAR_86711 [Caerostris darwini]|uniref:Uncharacterized protein n=1 Tax=Caerostris darwini TaxID=1538125 RepID=A0AAV4VEN8_9ARAC|nr:hypothetical protein CDAR_86711 [Caerostris darwini]
MITFLHVFLYAHLEKGYEKKIWNEQKTTTDILQYGSSTYSFKALSLEENPFLQIALTLQWVCLQLNLPLNLLSECSATHKRTKISNVRIQNWRATWTRIREGIQCELKHSFEHYYVWMSAVHKL